MTNTIAGPRINGEEIEFVETEYPAVQGIARFKIRTPKGRTQHFRVNGECLRHYVATCNKWGWEILGVTVYVRPCDPKIHALPYTNVR